jgi:hypothetical protein
MFTKSASAERGFESVRGSLASPLDWLFGKNLFFGLLEF